MTQQKKVVYHISLRAPVHGQLYNIPLGFVETIEELTSALQLFQKFVLNGEVENVVITYVVLEED